MTITNAITDDELRRCASISMANPMPTIKDSVAGSQSPFHSSMDETGKSAINKATINTHACKIT